MTDIGDGEFPNKRAAKYPLAVINRCTSARNLPPEESKRIGSPSSPTSATS
jgi:hypothetical protein